MYPNVIAVLFTIVKTWKKPKCTHRILIYGGNQVMTRRGSHHRRKIFITYISRDIRAHCAMNSCMRKHRILVRAEAEVKGKA